MVNTRSGTGVGLFELAAIVAATACTSGQAVSAAPNIVMIAIDDLNDFVAPLRGFEDVLPDPEVRARVTPHLERLAARGATFTNAQTAHPACNASRAAVMTGVSGETSGLSANDAGLNWRNDEPTRYTTTLPQLLKEHGYTISTTGKIWHNNNSDAPGDRADNAPVERGVTHWDEVRRFHRRASTPRRTVAQEWPIGADKAVNLRWSRWIPQANGKDDDSEQAWNRLIDSQDDQLAAIWTAERIAATGTSDAPHFIATGIFHPHLPWDAPGVFFDRFPIDQIRLPRHDAEDLNDLSAIGRRMGIRGVHPQVLAATPESDLAWRTAIQAYLASVSYADHAVGKILDAVETKNADDDPDNDWAVVLWSDHGWHLGEKEVWHKFTVWEEAARTNLMVYAPGVTESGQAIDAPVDLLAVAPTICDLAGVKPLPQMQGDSLLPLIAAPDSQPRAVALTTFGETERGNLGFHAKKYAIRSQRFRLVHHQDGSQELYDHDNDPDEFYNLLHPRNAAKAGEFGLGTDRVNSVRRRLGGRLFERLVKLNAKDVFVDGKVDLAAIETSGRSIVQESPTIAWGDGATASGVLSDAVLGADEDFIAAIDVRLDDADASVGFTFGGTYALSIDAGKREARLLRLEGEGVKELGPPMPLAFDARPETQLGGLYRLVADYRAATQTVELIVQDQHGVNLLRAFRILDAPIPADTGFGVRMVPGGGAASVERFLLLAEPGRPFSEDPDGELVGTTARGRVETRDYPSVFQAWNPIDQQGWPLDTTAGRLAAASKHDVLWEEPVSQLGYGVDLVLGAVWDHPHGGVATDFTPESKSIALANRAAMLQMNSHMVFLLEVRWRDAPGSFLPEDSVYWKRNADGSRVLGWDNGPEPYYLMDPDNAEFAANIARQCQIAIDSGIYDGVMFDWDGHLPIVKKVRQVIGDEGLIIVNIHDRIDEAREYGDLINGAFMELAPAGPGAPRRTLGTWKSSRKALGVFEQVFREPRLNCLEAWGDRADLRRMRAATTLGLTHSDGSVLFADPNPLPEPDHLHDWYPFWDLDLGRPHGRVVKRSDGAYERDFDGGLVVYNELGNGVVLVDFASRRRRTSDGSTGKSFRLQDADGDIFTPLGD